MDEKKIIIDNLFGELKRGTLVLSVLLNVKNPIYGYSLVEELKRKGVNVEKNTLYPLLRRLENQGLLTSYWDTSENRARKYYKISDMGSEILSKLIIEWRYLSSNIESML